MTHRTPPSPATRFRELFEQAPFSTQLISPEGLTLEVNKAWEQLWDPEGRGLLKDYVLKGGYNIFVDPQLEATGVAPLLRRAAKGERVQLPLIRYDPAKLNLPGTARWVKATAHPICDAAGEVLEIMLIHEDITEAYEAQSAERLSKLRLQQGLVAAKMVVWEWQLPSCAMSCSDNVKDVLGASPVSIDEFDKGVHPEDRPQLEAVRQAALDSGGSYQHVVRYSRADDARAIWLDIRGEVQVDPAGPHQYVRGVTVDVTERMTAEAELRDADRRKDEFLAMLAHELRNPLAPISTAAQLIKLNVSAEQRIQASDVITRQVGHMTELIDDLLDVSRVTRGLVELSCELLDLREIVHDAIEQATPLIRARGHTLGTRLLPVPALVNGDRLRLVQVLSNLLNNAAKYTPQHGRIDVEIASTDDVITLTVADNGVGIAPGALARMFHLFTQAERTPDRSQGGLGLGLPIVKSIMELHGGTVTAVSAGSGRGTTFMLSLPRVQGSVPQAVTPAAQRHEEVSALKTVLIVDDNVDAAESMAALLTQRGHQVRVAPDGESALQLAMLEPVQVFILDIGLPGIDGLELARRLRAHPPTRDSVLIALTGYGQAHDRTLSRSAGFDAHLVKPASLEQVEMAFCRRVEGLPPGQTH